MPGMFGYADPNRNRSPLAPTRALAPRTAGPPMQRPSMFSPATSGPSNIRQLSVGPGATDQARIMANRNAMLANQNRPPQLQPGSGQMASELGLRPMPISGGVSPFGGQLLQRPDMQIGGPGRPMMPPEGIPQQPIPIQQGIGGMGMGLPPDEQMRQNLLRRSMFSAAQGNPNPQMMY